MLAMNALGNPHVDVMPKQIPYLHLSTTHKIPYPFSSMEILSSWQLAQVFPNYFLIPIMQEQLQDDPSYQYSINT